MFLFPDRNLNTEELGSWGQGRGGKAPFYLATIYRVRVRTRARMVLLGVSAQIFPRHTHILIGGVHAEG